MKKSIYLISFLLSGCFSGMSIFETYKTNIQAFGLDKNGVCHPYFNKQTNQCNLYNNETCPSVTSSNHLEDLIRIKHKFCSEKNIISDTHENMCKKIENIIKCPDGYTNVESNNIISESKLWDSQIR